MEKFKIFDNFKLKIIALITMFIDHVGAILYPDNDLLRQIGRIAFPIFGFLIAQGFFYTYKKNKFKRYFLTMLLSSIIIEFLLFITHSSLSGHLNIFTTYVFSLLSLFIWEKMDNKNLPLKITFVLILLLISIIVRVDYFCFGVLFVFIIYFYIKTNNLLFFFLAYIPLFIVNENLFIGTLFSMLPLLLFNKKQGFHNKIEKYFFYVFYPAHIIILTMIAKNLLNLT